MENPGGRRSDRRRHQRWRNGVPSPGAVRDRRPVSKPDRRHQCSVSGDDRRLVQVGRHSPARARVVVPDPHALAQRRPDRTRDEAEGVADLQPPRDRGGRRHPRPAGGNSSVAGDVPAGEAGPTPRRRRRGVRVRGDVPGPPTSEGGIGVRGAGVLRPPDPGSDGRAVRARLRSSGIGVHVIGLQRGGGAGDQVEASDAGGSGADPGRKVRSQTPRAGIRAQGLPATGLDPDVGGRPHRDAGGVRQHQDPRGGDRWVQGGAADAAFDRQPPPHHGDPADRGQVHPGAEVCSGMEQRQGPIAR